MTKYYKVTIFSGCVFELAVTDVYFVGLGIHASNMSNASGRQTRRRFSIVSQHPEYDVVDIDEGDGDGDDDSV